MNNMESQSENARTEQRIDSPVELTKPTSIASPPKSRKKLIIIGGVFLGLCLCIGLCMVVLGSSLFGVATQRGGIENVIDAFMRAMADRNADQAYALFSTRAQKYTTRSILEKMLNTNDFALFYGYQKIELTNVSIGPSFNTNADTPQGITARVSGTATYDTGYTGSFQAILEKENNKWKLYHINITIPPDKVSDYLKTHP